MIKEHNYMPGKHAATAIATNTATFNDWITQRGVVRMTIVLGMKPRL